MLSLTIHSTVSLQSSTLHLKNIWVQPCEVLDSCDLEKDVYKLTLMLFSHERCYIHVTSSTMMKTAQIQSEIVLHEFAICICFQASDSSLLVLTASFFKVILKAIPWIQNSRNTIYVLWIYFQIGKYMYYSYFSYSSYYYLYSTILVTPGNR